MSTAGIESYLTPTSPVTGVRSLTPDAINYNADWRVLDSKPNEVTLINILAPTDKPMKLRVAWTSIPDVFKGSGIEPFDAGNYNSNARRQGVSVLMQLTGADVDESNGAGPYPWSVHLVLKVPTGGGVTHDGILSMLQALLGHLYDTKSTDPETRIEAIIRGALTPIDL